MHRVGCDEGTSQAIMGKALDAGINFFDTADVYGQDGLTERIIGNWFRDSGRRDEVVLATKCRFRMSDGPLGTGASRLRIVKAVDDSLRRLKTDRIDLYQIHMQDVDTPEQETLRALDDLVRAGKVLYIGASNYAAYRLVQSAWLSRCGHMERYISLQAKYNLLERDLEREHVPACRQHGLGLIPWSPLAGGFLTGKYTQNSQPSDGARLTKWQQHYTSLDNERNWRILDTVRDVAKELSSTPAAVSIAWLLTRETVTSVIFGARSLSQLDANLMASSLELPPEAVTRLDDISALELGYPYNFIQQIQGRW